MLMMLHVFSRSLSRTLSRQTTVPCVPAGVFSCPLVVSMRPIPADLLDTVVELTHQQPLAHGAPVHIGDPGGHCLLHTYSHKMRDYCNLCVCACVRAGMLGIEDLSKVTYGGSVELQPGDVPVFWACGVTAIEAIISSSKILKTAEAVAAATAAVIFPSVNSLNF